MTGTSPLYGPRAYDSRLIPQQPPQIRQHAGLLCMPLPWGEAQDVAPYALMEHYAPKRLREQEEHERQNPGVRAVSYTHLDVYKRQVPRSTTSPSNWKTP